jgi:hypothetical protein
LLGRARDCLLQLAASPGSLLTATLALNALFLPCYGWKHDAILYGMQVTNRVEGGRFANDLFFRFGSQDNYSFFSLATTPLAGAIGTPATFLLLYLVTIALFFWALMRLVRALIPDRVAATLGLLFLAVWMPPIGGLDLFHVNENFFTPRLLANALVLFALERMLAGRVLAPLLLLTGSLLVHPLMGFGGLLLFLFWVLFRYVPVRWLAGLACVGSVVALTVLLVPPIGSRLFGQVDSAWYTEVLIRSPHLFGTEWMAADWLKVLIALGVALAAWPYLGRDSRITAFMGALVVVTVLGIVGVGLVCCFPYALLLQGQPFRVLWLAQTLQAPLALLLAGHWWAGGRTGPRAAGVLLLGYLAVGGLPKGAEGVIFLTLFLIVAQFLRVTRSRGRPDWVGLSLAGALVGTVAISGTTFWVAFVVRWRDLRAVLDVDNCIRALAELIAPGYRLLLGLAALLVIGRLARSGRTFRLAALATFLVAQLLGGVLPQVPVVRERLDRDYADMRFVREFLRERPQTKAEPPTVYWPNYRLDCLWFDLKANSYFSWQQLGGIVFSRGTALEGRRRADLVAPFESDLVRRQRDCLPAWCARDMEQMFRADLHADPPSAQDLLKLCSDPDLDCVVARQEFPGLYAATNGTWFIYDCRALRSRPGLSRRDHGDRHGSGQGNTRRGQARPQVLITHWVAAQACRPECYPGVRRTEPCHGDH